MSSENNQNTYLEQAAASDESIQQVHARLSHQKPEKPDGNPTFPLLLLGIMCLAVFAGSIYLAHYSSRFDPLIYNENQKPSTTKQGAVQLTASQRGKRVFMANCAVCHQANGQGMPNVYPPLVASEWVTDPANEKHMVRIVINGLQGPITVAGKEFNNVMAPMGHLNDQQIADVLSYIRTDWGNEGPEVSVETVSAVRAEIGGRTGMWTVEELKRQP
jgi:mono/diheme cytochrome c family protein